MTVGRVRPAVAAMASYRPGKSAVQAEDEHGITDAIKLASNENPYQPVPAIVAAIAAAAGDVNRYGDHRAADLRSAIAGWLDVDVDRVTAGCGSVGLLQQLLLAYVDPGDEVVYPWPSFEAYPIDVQLTGGVEVTVPLVDHAFDLDAVAAAVTDRTKLVLLANPNNPTGTAVHVDQVRRLVERIPGDVIVVVDEAYREFVTAKLGDPIADLQPDHSNVVVLRTFSKAFGLAGLRIGFGVADLAIIRALLAVKPTWNMGRLQIAGGIAALDDSAHLDATVVAILDGKEHVIRRFAELDRFRLVPGTRSNFMLIEILDQDTDSTIVFNQLLERGVIVKDGSVSFRGMGKRYLRADINLPPQMDRLVDALADLPKPPGSTGPSESRTTP